MKDLVEAMIQLYGGPVYHMAMRDSPGGGGSEHLNDWAARWLDGDREKVEAEIAKRESEVRGRPVPVIAKRVRVARYDPQLIRNLRCQGKTLQEISEAVGCSVTRAGEVCRCA